MKQSTDYTQLIIRYFEGTADDREIALLSDWLKASKENRKHFDQLNEDYQLIDMIVKSWLFDLEKNWEELQQRIHKEKTRPSTKMVPLKHLWRWRLIAAVSLLVALTSSGLFFSTYQSEHPNQQFVKVIAPRGEKSKIILHDNTLVWLNSESQLNYKYDDVLNRRIVNLKGEGFFEVSKSEDTPFVVITDHVEINVHGTRFNVSAYDNDDFVQTTLEKGSISLKVTGSHRKIAVREGQQFTYNKLSGRIQQKNVNIKSFASWKESKLKFVNAPFSEVVKKLERWYDVDIELAQQLQHSERFTMTITTESLREVLNRIRLTTAIDFTIKENKVMISRRNKKQNKGKPQSFFVRQNLYKTHGFLPSHTRII